MGTYLGDQVLFHHSSEREGDPVDVTLQGHLHLSLSGLPLLIRAVVKIDEAI